MAFPSPQELLGKVQGGASSSPFFASTPKAPIPSPQDVLSRSQAPAPSFASNLIHDTKRVVGGIAKKIGSFFGAQAETIKETVAGRVKLTPDDVLEGVKKTSAGIGNGITAISQGFNEGVARIAKSTFTATVGPDITRKIANSPIGDFAKVATGRQNFLDIEGVPQPKAADEPLADYQEIYGKAQNYALENNASIDQAKAFGGLAVAGMIFADNPAFGPGKGSIFKLSEQALEQIAKETSEDGIKEILKRELPNLAEKELDLLVPVFRNTTDEASVRAAVEQIDQAIRVPVKDATTDLPAPESLLESSRKAIEIPPATIAENVAGASRRDTPFFRAIPDEATQTTRFERVQGEAVDIFPGVETFIRKGPNDTYEVLEGSTGRMIGKVADSAEAAVQSAKEAFAGKSPEEVLQRIQSHVEKAPRGTPGGATTRVPEQSGPVPKPFRQELIRTISAEEMPGPIVDVLAREFPAISDHALSPIAKRLAGLSRPGDIEGILHVVRNINSDLEAARGGAKVKLGQKSIAKVGEPEAVGDLPPSVGALLTSEERGKYLENISRTIKTHEEAVLAQQEYDALWEHADQKIIDRYEELKTYRDILRDQIESHQGKELNSLYKGTFVSPDDVSLDELIGHPRGKNVDSRIGEIMMGQEQPGLADTTAQAQKALDSWKEMRADLAALEDEMREIRPKARAARILQDMVEDVPVITRENAGKIEALAAGDDIRKKYKDISGFSSQSRDVYRNFEAVFGEKFPEVKKVILDPFDKSKGDMVDEITKLADDLEKNVVKKYGIQRGSKESAAIQLYGEGLISHEELIAKVGSDRVEAILASVAYFRKAYDRLIDEVNVVRKKIFPNDPSKLIPKRKDYFRHFQEMSDGFKALINLFDTPAGIKPELAGLSEFTKPKSKFLSFAQERVGKDSDIDAIGGFMNYAPSFSYAKHIDQHIGNFRYLRRRLAENAPTPGTKEFVSATDEYLDAMGGKELVKQNGLNNFISFLDDFANDLAGKTNPMDRYLQKIIPGGRTTFKVIDWINSRVKANTILGNLGSAIAQIFNVPQGIASAKLYSLPGIERTLASIFVENEPMKASSFIKERYQESIANRFKTDWLEHPVKGTTERGKEIAVWITGAMDEVGTKFIWNSHYQKAIAEGVEDPVKYADDITRKLVAGRGVGEVPLLQKSKVFQLVAPFQLEVGNAWRVMGDFVKQKDFGAIAIFFIASYLMNAAAEKVRGSKVVFDPIASLIDGATQASDELDDTGSPTRAAFKFVGRQVGEILSNVPLGQTVAAALPEDWVTGASGGLIKDKKDLFGEADPARFGSGLIAIKGIGDPLYKLIPPFGGQQVKKTIDGIASMVKGQVTDAKDNLSFKTSPTFLNIVQATLFGKNATTEAQKFYDERSDLFNRIYRQDANRTQENIEAEKVWADVKDLRDAGKSDEAIAKMQALEQSDPLLAEAVADVAQSEADGLTGTDRLVKMLNVENGERAKYIAETVKDLKTRDEQVQFLQNLDDKKLISDTVFQQLEILMEGAIKSE